MAKQTPKKTEKTEKTLWLRKLKCGHKRETNINYQMKIYDKPEVGGRCYCRECMEETTIVGVEKIK